MPNRTHYNHVPDRWQTEGDEWRTPDSLFQFLDQIYHFTLDEAYFNSSARSLTIKNFRIIPLLGEDATMRAAGEQTDRFDFHLGTVALKNLDLPQLMTGAIYAGIVILAAGAASAWFRQRRTAWAALLASVAAWLATAGFRPTWRFTYRAR